MAKPTRIDPPLHHINETAVYTALDAQLCAYMIRNRLSKFPVTSRALKAYAAKCYVSFDAQRKAAKTAKAQERLWYAFCNAVGTLNDPQYLPKR